MRSKAMQAIVYLLFWTVAGTAVIAIFLWILGWFWRATQANP